MQLRASLLLMASAAVGWADFQMVQTIRITMNPTLAGAAGDMDLMEAAKIPKSIRIEVQGSNMRVRHGHFQFLYLLEGGAVNIIDDSKKTYTTVTLPEWDEFSEHLATSMANPNKDPQYGEMRAKIGNGEWLKVIVERKPSGKAEQVAGFAAEPSSYDWRFDPTNAPDPRVAQMFRAQKFRVTEWTAAEPPQFAELTAAHRKLLAMFDGTKAMTKAADSGGDAGQSNWSELEKIRAEHTSKKRIVVKTVMGMYMDFTALGIPAPPQLQKMAGEAMSTFTVSIESFHTELLDPKDFIVPSGYRRVAIREMDLSGVFPLMLY